MQIITSLSFQGQCREAFEFYARVLGGEIITALPYNDVLSGMPATIDTYKGWLMHCWLQVGDQALIGADMDHQWAPNIGKPKNGFDVTLQTADLVLGERWYHELSAGGEQIVPFSDTFWSPGFGTLRDKFGIPWMINVKPDV